MNQNPGKKTVLVVDDDPTALLFASGIIRRAGYRIIEAGTGYEAVRMTRQHSPDLVLLDVMLPDISGLDVCRTIKSDPLLRNTYVILFSAIQTQSIDKAVGLETGADGYLVKPVDQRELIAQIKAMFRLKRAEEKISNQKKWYETVLNSLQEVVICMDTHLNIIWANKSALDSVGCSLASALGQKCSTLFGCTEEAQALCPVVQSIESGRTEHALVKTSDGRVWDTRAYPVKDEQGNIINMVEVAMNVTRNINTRKALERSEALLKEVTARMPGAVIQYQTAGDGSFKVAYVSQGIFNLLGISSESILHNPDLLWEKVHPEDKDDAFRQLKKSMEQNRAFGSDFRVYGPGENIKWLRLSTVPYEHDDSTAWYAMLTDITPLKIVEQELTRRAMHDPLTGLPNRQLFNDRLDQAISYAQRYSQKVGLIFIDLDGFKPINDRFGHMFGDAVLQTVARRLASCSRKTDTVARFGGDEFVIILSSLNSIDDAQRILYKINEIMHMQFQVDGQSLKIGASIGVSIYPDDAGNVIDLVQAADKAMYKAKKTSGVNCLLYGDLTEEN